MRSICSKKSDDQLSKKLMTTRDEELLVYKIVKSYSDFGMKDALYKVLTGEDYSDPFLFLEAQPYSQRQNEGNSYLDIAMGSMKIRKETESGIEFDEEKEKKEFLFCEAKWASDISLGVENCSTRNQLQRVIDNALYFCTNSSLIDKIHVTLITPKKYKEEYGMRLGSRLYQYKYCEYKNNPSMFLRELETIKKELPWREGKNYDSLLKENIEKLSLRWVTFEEIIESIANLEVRNEIYEEYNNIKSK